MDWDQALDRFATALKWANRSPHTMSGYLSDLTLAANYWQSQQGRHDILTDLQNLTADDIANWLFYESTRHSPRTVQRRRASLKLFLAYAVEQGWIPTSPFPDSRVIRSREQGARPEVIYLTTDEARRLMAAVEQGAPQDPLWVQYRDRAFFWVLLGTGLRISEACGLTVTQIHDGMRREILSVVGKGNKRRDLAFPPALHGAVQTYLHVRPATALSAFFLTQQRVPKGQEFPVRALQPREIQRRIKRYAEVANLTTQLTPHKLRHTYATALLATGVDIRVVQEALGHSHLATTEIYTHVRMETQRAAAEHIEYLPSKARSNDTAPRSP